MNKIKTIEIKDLKGEVIFAHTAESNTVLHTVINAVHNLNELRGADLRYADLTFVDFKGIDFTGADFTGADCRGADLTKADFTGVDLRGAKLRSASYTQEQIDSAITDETTIY